ncbi:hypothetical protein [Streptomyces violascens]|uniref:hypothetical protein n=1 Tax=Streptomyces violascens TaxID=67381 RepID=UPI003648C918
MPAINRTGDGAGRGCTTPWVAIVVVGAVALLLFIASIALGSVQDIKSNVLTAIDLQAALSYGLATVVAYRRTLIESVGSFPLGGAWPLLGSGLIRFSFVDAPRFSRGGRIRSSRVSGAGMAGSRPGRVGVHRNRWWGTLCGAIGLNCQSCQVGSVA